MRIAYLIATVHDLGGTAGAVVTQANALCERHEVQILSVYDAVEEGHRFSIDPRVTVRDLVVEVAGSDPGVDALRGVDPYLIQPGDDPGFDARADVALEATLPTLQADVLVTVTPAGLAYAVQLAPPAVAVVHQEHRSSASRAHSRSLLLDRVRRADAVAVLTEPMAFWLREELGAAAPEVVVVPNALPPGFRPRSLLTEPVILSAGRLVTEKQWPHLLLAFADIADRIPEWRLRIFGDGPARYEVRTLGRKLGLWDRVELPGATPDLVSEWPRASIMSLTSQPGEGFPLVVQEAMAAGVPVVAYDMPTGPRHQIDSGIDGLLVSQGSRAGLAAGLLRLATDVDERRRMGTAARARSADWDGAAVTARWEEIFAGALARRRGAGDRVPIGRVTALAAGRAAAASAVPAADHGDRSGGGLTPVAAREQAFRAVAAAAAAVGARWWVVPPHAGSAPVVCLPMSARASFVAALTELGLPAWLSVHDPAHRGWPSRRGTPSEMAESLRRGRTPRVLVEPWPDAGGTSVIGRGCEVVVEFWEEGPDGDLHAGGRQSYTRVMPHDTTVVTATVLGVEVPSVPLMLAPTLAEVRFPIDVVYTWVDGADPAWNTAREARLAAVDDASMRSEAASGRARYLERGELRWSLRSLHLFAPWVRRIHLVTAGQVPAWLDVDHPAINVVPHVDLLPPEALPTFNSHAVESVLHTIEGLSEQFLYLNDDFFLGGPSVPEDFFSAAGATAVFPSPILVGLPGQDDLPYLHAAATNRRLLQDAFGAVTLTTMAHAPYAHRVSVLREIADRFPAELAATARAPFRSATDVSLLSSLAQHYGLATGTAYAVESDWAYVDLTDVVVPRRFSELLRRDRAGFCLGEGHDWGRDPADVGARLATFLDTYFPIPAPWERPSRRDLAPTRRGGGGRVGAK